MRLFLNSETNLLTMEYDGEESLSMLFIFYLFEKAYTLLLNESIFLTARSLI